MITIANVKIENANVKIKKAPSCTPPEYAEKYFLELEDNSNCSDIKFISKYAQVVTNKLITDYTRPEFYFNSISDALKAVALYLEKPKTAEEQLSILKKKWKEFKRASCYSWFAPEAYYEIDEILSGE